jgi:pilus assembly protein Flp/PilA
MFEAVRRLCRSEEGAALIEYGMLVMLVALLCIVAIKTVGSKVNNSFNSANALLP